MIYKLAYNYISHNKTKVGENPRPLNLQFLQRYFLIAVLFILEVDIAKSVRKSDIENISVPTLIILNLPKRQQKHEIFLCSQITSKQVYQILTCFDKIYFEMTDMEKKEFFRSFIDEIELYSDRQSDGRIVKQINFKFPVYYNGNEGNAIIHRQ